MKNIFKSFLLCVVTGCFLMVFSCNKRDIKGEQIHVSDVDMVLVSNNGTVTVPTDSNYVKSVDDITVPIEISFSDAVPKRFQVDLDVDEDTIMHMIANKQLKNTVLIPSNYYNLPSQLDVRFGLDHIKFNLVVGRTAVERNYGKNLAIAIRLNNPTKNNTVEKDKREIIVVLNTSKIVSTDEIHYVYFTGADSLLQIPQKDHSYDQDQTYLTVPVSISLGGEAGDAFNVRLQDNPDTVQALLDSGDLPNTVLLRRDTDYIIPDSVDYGARKNLFSFDLKVNVDTLKKYLGKKVALALTLEDPNKHLLDTTRKTVVIVLNPATLVESDVTNVGSTLSVQRDNSNDNEASPKVVDDNINTKFLLFNFTTVWIQLKFDSAQVVNGYKMISANDASGRDPKDWQVLGSNNGVTWTVLDIQTGQSFLSRQETKKYNFNNDKPYTYYRLLITKNNGDGLFQMAEWRLLHRP